MSEEEKQESSSEDVFHFIRYHYSTIVTLHHVLSCGPVVSSYTHVNGRLYELDGLQKGPILLGECTADNWLDKVTLGVWMTSGPAVVTHWAVCTM